MPDPQQHIGMRREIQGKGTSSLMEVYVKHADCD
jgi:hypothetical protein